MKSKNKKNTVWIVFTCIFALTTVVLAMALYRSHSTLEAVRVQLAEGQTNTITAETNQSRQQLAGAHNMQAVRVMNGILQQQDENEQWVDVAPVADLQQADPVLAGRNKMQELIRRAKELLADGTVVRVLGWKAGDMPWNPEPAFFENEEELKDFVYDGFCGANLSKMMIEASKLDGKTMVCLKPCDTYSFNQLLSEHRVDREKAYIVGVGCKGKLDIEKIRSIGIRGIRKIEGASLEDAADTLKFETASGEKTCAYADAMLGRCHVCKGKEHQIYDELIGESKDTKDQERFTEVERIEAMSPQERFAYFQSELSKCIRCNACRNVCPACSCRKCVFDSNKFDSAQKANVDSFEEKMFHIIRAFHVAGRCTDCGECSRVCPQGIPLHLFNRKFIKDIDELYGTYQAGEAVVERSPLTSYTFEDAEPGIVAERG